jgi:glutathione S-transferase
MADTVTFYHNPQSRGRIAHWMLEESGAPYEIKVVDFGKMQHKAKDFLAINPMGKIPAIVHRGMVVTESAAICAYLADAFPAAGLAPALEDPKRGTYLRWLFFGAGCVEPAIIDQMFSRPAPSRPAALGYGNYPDTVNTLEQAITPGPFVLGSTFSAADVYLGSAIGWGLMMKALEPRPAFGAYLGLLSARPAYKRFTAQNVELERKKA